MTLAELNTYFQNVNNLARAESILENLQAAVGPQSPSLLRCKSAISRYNPAQGG